MENKTTPLLLTFTLWLIGILTANFLLQYLQTLQINKISMLTWQYMAYSFPLIVALLYLANFILNRINKMFAFFDPINTNCQNLLKNAQDTMDNFSDRMNEL